MWGRRGKSMDGDKPSKADAPPPLSLGELLKRLVEDTGTLFRSELRLAQAELTANIGKAMQPLSMIMLGGLLLLGGLFTLLGALVAWLTPLVGAGFAALIVAIAAAGAGLGLVAAGKKQLTSIGFLPSRVAKALQDDVKAFEGQQP